MDFNQIFTFLTTGESTRVLGIVVAFLVFSGIAGFVIYYTLDSLFGIFKKLFEGIKRKDRIVEVPKYNTPPQIEDFERCVKDLKKILDDNKNSIKL